MGLVFLFDVDWRIAVGVPLLIVSHAVWRGL